MCFCFSSCAYTATAFAFHALHTVHLISLPKLCMRCIRFFSSRTGRSANVSFCQAMHTVHLLSLVKLCRECVIFADHLRGYFPSQSKGDRKHCTASSKPTVRGQDYQRSAKSSWQARACCWICCDSCWIVSKQNEQHNATLLSPKSGFSALKYALLCCSNIYIVELTRFSIALLLPRLKCSQEKTPSLNRGDAMLNPTQRSNPAKILRRDSQITRPGCVSPVTFFDSRRSAAGSDPFSQIEIRLINSPPRNQFLSTTQSLITPFPKHQFQVYAAYALGTPTMPT